MRSFTKDELDTVEKLRHSTVERTAFFEAHREELKQLAKLRMSKQLRKRVDESDVIQDAFVKYCVDLDAYLADPRIPPHAWLKRLIRQVVSRVNRTHITAKCRDARRESSLGENSMATIERLAALLSSVGKPIYREELRQKIVKTLMNMAISEREILTLVHYEKQTLRQAAETIGINMEAAKKRYLRALKRIQKLHAEELSPFLS